MIRTAPLRRSSRLRRTAPLRKRRKTRKGQVPEAVLDALWGKRVHQRDRERCRYGVWAQGVYLNVPIEPWLGVCWGPMQAHHIYTKKYRNLRWDEEDGLLLCARHHSLMHDAPVLAGRFYEALLGRMALDTLWMKARAKAKVDRAAVKAFLQDRLRAMEGTG